MHLTTPDIESVSTFRSHFLSHQIDWITAEQPLHQQGKQAIALVEKSIRIGWTYADAFKNVRKRILFKNRDYLFATKDYPSAVEYVAQCIRFADIFNLTQSIVSSNVQSLTDTIKAGVIRFDNGSRIIAFSANPQAMAVHGGDVGLDEFAKHSNARLLWETAQGRIALGGDLAIWSAHDGEDTLFNEFAQEARAGAGPWNIYRRVTMEDAINNGLIKTFNEANGTNLNRETFLADCRKRAREDGIFEQCYLCNPLGATTNHIVDWSAIERSRYDYEIARVHLEHVQIIEKFGEFNPSQACNREHEIGRFLLHAFNKILTTKSNYRLGFEVAASGQGDLAVIYIDEANGDELSLRALFTCRTEDWHFLKTVLFFFLRMLKSVKAAGDETGLGKQICWEAASQFGSLFSKVNFSGKKHDLGFALMNQLATTQKRFPRSQQDIASDYFALRKEFSGTRWVFSEGRNALNPVSHCDIAWAGALASHAHTQSKCSIGCAILMEDGTVLHSDGERTPASAEHSLLWSDDPRIWRPLR
jgi:phage FluMu gp28-like protein